MESMLKLEFEVGILEALANAYESTYVDVEPNDEANQLRAMLMIDDILDKIKHLKQTVEEVVEKYY